MKENLFIILVLGLVSCSKVDKKHFCSRESNSLRKRFEIPIIEDNMKVADPTESFRCKWTTSEQYRSDTIPLHVWKVIVPGKSVLSLESDAFRKRIDDTLLYQLNIESKIHKDSSVTITGFLFYTHTNDRKSRSPDFDMHGKSLDEKEFNFPGEF